MFLSSSSSRVLLFFSFLIAFSFTNSVNGVAVLPTDEVQALRDFGATIGKSWDFSVDPCTGDLGWETLPLDSSNNAVDCNCTFSNNTVCHVFGIFLKEQNLQGTLPKDLSGLPYLQNLDLTRNYLNGTIPAEWGTSKLVTLSLLGNRLTGSFPKEIANISTLTDFVVENNMLSGELPLELGSMLSIERLLLTSNNFSGELPSTLEGLSTLTDFRIGDNQFIGSIPTFIQNWTNLEKLVIQGSGLSGPIPLEIASLTNIIDLRISDLNGNETNFPPLEKLTKLKTLILRSCNIIGTIPDYLGGITNITILDLSFNKLSGEIPINFAGLIKADIFLTGNLLTGQVPDWMLKNGRDIDLSYNNFTTEISVCQERSVNLFKSSSNGTNNGISPCLRNIHCPQISHDLYINCGGAKVTLGGKTYDADTDGGGPAQFFQSSTNWAFSSTGNFLDDGVSNDNFILSNMSILSMNDSELYTKARLSATTLTYYGFCLGNGNYTVNLHFAETRFTDDKTFSSLGRRIFDVYIQGERKLKDFDIAGEAGGFGKAIIKNFTAAVTNNTLDIRFYWAGKGTISIPTRGVYGPLISAISVVDPDYIPPPASAPSSGNSISVGTVVGIVFAVLGFILVVLGILWWKGCIGRKYQMAQDLKDLDLKTGSFTLRQIKAATNDFDPVNKIGEGGFGPVYKGVLADGTIIAVKQLSSKSKQGNREFVNEIGMISALQHPNLVKLHGCCIEGNQLLLVYEYLENNSLARALFGPEKTQLKLDWPTRHKICVGIARGLAYLHEESRLKIVHRDIKATNVLLDKNLDPKISDFGLAKLDEEDNTHMSTRIAGTYGYMAPEYAMRGHLTDKADVYSFGIVALEIVSGKGNTLYHSKDQSFYLLDWAQELKAKGKLMELVDTRLDSDYDKEEAMVMINVALICSDPLPASRPSMSAVVSMLEGKVVVQESVSDPNFSKEEMKNKLMKDFYELTDEQTVADIGPHSTSTVGPWSNSSTSAPDLYPVYLDSDYLKNRE